MIDKEVVTFFGGGQEPVCRCDSQVLELGKVGRIRGCSMMWGLGGASVKGRSPKERGHVFRDAVPHNQGPVPKRLYSASKRQDILKMVRDRGFFLPPALRREQRRFWTASSP